MEGGTANLSTPWPSLLSTLPHNNTTTTTTTTNVSDDARITVGVALSVFGNILISVAMNVKKYSHNRLLGQPGKSYLRSPIWWAGMFTFIVGEIGNFAAYGYAPASLVAPLGTTSVISNAAIACLLLKVTFFKARSAFSKQLCLCVLCPLLLSVTLFICMGKTYLFLSDIFSQIFFKCRIFPDIVSERDIFIFSYLCF